MMLHKYKYFLIEQLGIPYQVQQAEDRIFNNDKEKNYEDLKNYLKANSDYKYAEDALDKKPSKVVDWDKHKAQIKERDSYRDQGDKPFTNIVNRTYDNYHTYKDEQQKDSEDNIFKDKNRITPKTKEEKEADNRILYTVTSSSEYIRGNGYEKYRKNPITDLKQNVLDDMKAENDKELSKIPSAKINTPDEAEDIKAYGDEVQRKIKEKQAFEERKKEEELDYQKRRSEAEAYNKAAEDEQNKRIEAYKQKQQNLKLGIAGGALAAAGTAALIYSSYKNSQRNKWKKYGCSNTNSSSEKEKCQKYLDEQK